MTKVEKITEREKDLKQLRGYLATATTREVSVPVRKEYAEGERQQFERKPIPVVYCILRNVSRSGMSRRISLYIIDKVSGEPLWLDPVASRLLGWSIDRKSTDGGISVSGCGMDMGFHLVSTLSQVAFGETYGLTKEWL